MSKICKVSSVIKIGDSNRKKSYDQSPFSVEKLAKSRKNEFVKKARI